MTKRTEPETVTITLDVPSEPIQSLPSPNINHASVYLNEVQARLSGFEAGIIALTGEMEGQQEVFQAAAETLKTDYEAATAKLTEAHNKSKADLLRRIDDMNLGKAMAAAALDAHSAAQTKGGGAT